MTIPKDEEWSIGNDILWFSNIFFSCLENLYYVLTNKRIIIKKGLVGIDYDVLDLDSIRQVNVDVGFWDKKYGAGTPTIQAMRVQPIKLYAVREPRKVYEILNKAVRARKQPT
ncbi:MAG: PH domain-containing protein [Thermoprotei archaeon]